MRVAPLLALALVLFLLPLGDAGPSARRFEGAGIVVSSFNVQSGQITVLDNGAVVCHSTNGGGPSDTGVGGNCLPFGALYQTPGMNAITVVEDCTTNCLTPCPPGCLSMANTVTFQVCVDNNGDGLCTGLRDISDNQPMNQPPNCSFDSIFYSHSTTTSVNRGRLYVPAWAQTFWQNCGGFGYPGYVVIVCAGVHNNNQNTQPHTHTATRGSIMTTGTTDLTSGNYCGAPTATKAYKLV